MPGPQSDTGEGGHTGLPADFLIAPAGGLEFAVALPEGPQMQIADRTARVPTKLQVGEPFWIGHGYLPRANRVDLADVDDVARAEPARCVSHDGVPLDTDSDRQGQHGRTHLRCHSVGTLTFMPYNGQRAVTRCRSWAARAGR